MSRIRSLVGLLLGISALVVVGCGSGGEQDSAAGREAEWKALKASHQSLQDSRSELAELRQQLADAKAAPAEEGEEAAAEPAGEMMEGEAEGEAAEAAEAPMTPEEIEARSAQVETDVATQAEDFGRQLVEFINADPIVQGEEPTELQREALRLKSSEDILLAQEYIDKGGDYRRAIEIYEAALMVDPDNEAVAAALEQAKADRFMTEERFAQASTGMSEDQVRALLGHVYHHNVREYPEKNVTAWFYPKEEGGAAGVYFQLDEKSEQYVVYRTDFAAVKSPTEEGGEGTEEAAAP